MVGYAKEKLMKLIKVECIKNVALLDSGLHETILFRIPHKDEGNMTTASRSKSQPAQESRNTRGEPLIEGVQIFQRLSLGGCS